MFYTLHFHKHLNSHLHVDVRLQFVYLHASTVELQLCTCCFEMHDHSLQPMEGKRVECVSAKAMMAALMAGSFVCLLEPLKRVQYHMIGHYRQEAE